MPLAVTDVCLREDRILPDHGRLASLFEYAPWFATSFIPGGSGFTGPSGTQNKKSDLAAHYSPWDMS